jgi:SAM-dependent methyltransferase
MSQADPLPIRLPRSDDRLLLDIEFGSYGYLAVLVAHDLGLFELLSQQPRPLAGICLALNLERRPAEALLNIGLSLGLLEWQAGAYALTAVAEDYLVKTSPTYFGGVLDLDIAAPPTFESLKRAILTNSQQVYGGGDWVQSHQQQAQLAQTFTRAMHGYSMAAALAWPGAIDLSPYQLMLDVGGGSGAHCIGATQRWNHLNAIVFDLPPVCDVAQELIARQNLHGRIHTQAGDMWLDPYPASDLHFYSMIFHDWPLEKCRLLVDKSYASLAPGGRLIVHEMLYDDDKAGPYTVAACNVLMLFATEGEQYSGRELTSLLADAGFGEVEVKRTFGYWSIVTGRKPG